MVKKCIQESFGGFSLISVDESPTVLAANFVNAESLSKNILFPQDIKYTHASMEVCRGIRKRFVAAKIWYSQRFTVLSYFATPFTRWGRLVSSALPLASRWGGLFHCGWCCLKNGDAPRGLLSVAFVSSFTRVASIFYDDHERISFACFGHEWRVGCRKGRMNTEASVKRKSAICGRRICGCLSSVPLQVRPTKLQLHSQFLLCLRRSLHFLKGHFTFLPSGTTLTIG